MSEHKTDVQLRVEATISEMRKQEWVPEILDCRELLDCDVAETMDHLKRYMVHIKEHLPSVLSKKDKAKILETKTLKICIKALLELVLCLDELK